MKVVKEKEVVRVINEEAGRLKKGDKVYWFDMYDNLQYGTITGEHSETSFVINSKGRESIPTGAKKENCWPTKEDCLRAEVLRAEEQTKLYMESIGSVEDLVKFLFGHDIHGEFPDYEAKAAVKKKAAEFGIELQE